jgi:mannosylglucosylglycerate synthase
MCRGGQSTEPRHFNGCVASLNWWLMARVGFISFRLGLTDGVSIEAEKWAGALQSLGHSVVTIAGEGPVDHLIPGLAIDTPADPDLTALRRAVAAVDVCIVENLASLPLNLDARDAVYEVLRDRPAIFRHHDLPWQRPHLQHLEGPAHLGPWAHVTINDRSRLELAKRGITAVTIPNHFDCDPPEGRRDLMRTSIHVKSNARVILQPTRAIPRKNVTAGLRLAERLGAIYWLLGKAEDGFGTDLERLLRQSMTGVRRGLSEGATMDDAYAACDLVVMPSTWEGFGNPVIEAVTHRKPLARYRYPVMEEIESHGFRFFDLDDLDGIEAAMADPDAEYLEKNLAIAKATYDLALLPGRLSDLLETVGVR